MMLVHGLRLLVAIITFVVGVGAGRLFGSESRPCGKRIRSYTTVQVAPPLDAPPTPRVECRVSFMANFISGRAVSQPAPAYPLAAKAAGVQGMVIVKVEVDESGSVVKARAASGHELLREAAEDAARLMRISPIHFTARPEKADGSAYYTFKLN